MRILRSLNAPAVFSALCVCAFWVLPHPPIEAAQNCTRRGPIAQCRDCVYDVIAGRSICKKVNRHAYCKCRNEVGFGFGQFVSICAVSETKDGNCTYIPGPDECPHGECPDVPY